MLISVDAPTVRMKDLICFNDEELVPIIINFTETFLRIFQPFEMTSVVFFLLILGSFAEEDIGRQGIDMGNATASRGLEVAVANLQDYCNGTAALV